MTGLTDEEIAAMIFEIVETVDYDHAKDLKPESAEDPDAAEGRMAELVDIARSHIEGE